MTNASETTRQYRLRAPALAINFTELRPCLKTVPAGSVLEIPDAHPSGARFLEALWGEQVLYVLRSDVELSIARATRPSAA